jgi:lysophospholipase L1-like esterase
MRILRVLGLASLSLVLLPPLLAAPAVAARRPNPAMAPITDDPALPRVLLIGDSISIGYTLPVRDMLKGKANVHRILTNGGPTSNGVVNLDKWLGTNKWDIIHFNFGLHDLKIMASGKHQVPIQDYESNLKKITARLKQTQAKLIWAATTPVPPGPTKPPRGAEDVRKYNTVAEKVMKDSNIPINDLYTLALPILPEIQLPKNVHFTPAGYKVLAEQVVKSLEQAMR